VNLQPGRLALRGAGVPACGFWQRPAAIFGGSAWNKQKDINEPTQKAILLHDKGREDLVLQVKYEGPAQDFGWLIPVPGLARRWTRMADAALDRKRQRNGGENIRTGHFSAPIFASFLIF
jgi:hypothetical protein